MTIENIAKDGWLPTGFYTPAKKIDIGNAYMIFVSGMQPEKGIVNFKEQTISVFETIGKILKNAGATFDDVIETVIYLTDISNFADFSQIRQNYFKNSKPVSTLVEVSALGESHAKIEIKVNALIKK